MAGRDRIGELPEGVRTHLLGLLDCRSLCNFCQTNKPMRKAAEDNHLWKALYHRDFTLLQDGVVPELGWKAYYKVTKEVVNINTRFFDVIRQRAAEPMRDLWLNADYVGCFFPSGHLYTGYDNVMLGWQLVFNNGPVWDDFQVQDVCVRALREKMAWVSMKHIFDYGGNQYSVYMTNVFEYHNGRWYLVHHFNSLMFFEGFA